MTETGFGRGERDRAVVLVRNAVTHDARVLREAEALRLAGYVPLVIGVRTAEEPRARSTEGGVPIVRIDPLGSARGALERIRSLARGRTPATGDRPTAAPAGARPGPATPARRSRVRRIAVSVDFHRRAIGIVRRVRPTLVHCNDHNTMWAGVIAKALFGTQVVYDSHELWPDRNGRREWRPGLLLAEALFTRSADHVLTTSPGYAEVLFRRYRRRPQLIRNVPASRAMVAAPPDAESPVAVYVGGLLRGRGIEQAIEALRLVPGLRLRCIGPGASSYRDELLDLARHRGVHDRVQLVEPVAPTEVVGALSGAAVGLCLIQPVCLSYELTLPNKLFEYAAAGLPVVASDLPVIAGVVQASGCGLVVPPADAAAAAQALRDVLEPARWRTLSEAAWRLSSETRWPDERERLVRVYASCRRPAGRTARTCW